MEKLSSVRTISAAARATSVPPLAHGAANICGPEGWGVVDPVAGHGHHLALGLQGPDNAHLMLRGDPGKDVAGGDLPL